MSLRRRRLLRQGLSSVVLSATCFLDSAAGHVRIMAGCLSKIEPCCLFVSPLFQYWSEIMALFQSLEESGMKAPYTPAAFQSLCVLRTEQTQSLLVYSNHFPLWYFKYKLLLIIQIFTGTDIRHVFVLYISAIYFHNNFWKWIQLDSWELRWSTKAVLWLHFGLTWSQQQCTNVQTGFGLQRSPTVWVRTPAGGSGPLRHKNRKTESLYIFRGRSNATRSIFLWTTHLLGTRRVLGTLLCSL